MPISFACPQCARPIKAPDNLAGKQGKCPGCGSVFTVPAAPAPTAHIPPAHAPVARPAGPPPHAAAAGLPPVMPAGTHGVPSGAVPGQPAVALDQPTFAPAAPARRKKPNWIMPLVIGGSAAGLLLLVGVAVLAFTMLRGGASSAMRYLPHDADMFASIRIDDIREHEAAKVLLNNSQVSSAMSQMEADSGLKPADVSQIFAAGSIGKNGKGVVVVLVKQSIDPDAFVKKLRGTWKEETIGDLKVRTKRDEAIGFPDKKTIVFGDPAALRAALAKDRKPGFNPRLQLLVDSLSLSKTVALATVPPAGSLDLPPGMPFDATMLKDFTGAIIEVSLSGDLNVRCDVRCKDASTAKDYADMATGGLAAFRKGAPVPPDARAALESVKISTSGSSLSATATVKKDTLVSLAKEGTAAAGRMP